MGTKSDDNKPLTVGHTKIVTRKQMRESIRKENEKSYQPNDEATRITNQPTKT